MYKNNSNQLSKLMKPKQFTNYKKDNYISGTDFNTYLIKAPILIIDYNKIRAIWLEKSKKDDYIKFTSFIPDEKSERTPYETYAKNEILKLNNELKSTTPRKNIKMLITNIIKSAKINTFGNYLTRIVNKKNDKSSLYFELSSIFVPKIDIKGLFYIFNMKKNEQNLNSLEERLNQTKTDRYNLIINIDELNQNETKFINGDDYKLRDILKEYNIEFKPKKYSKIEMVKLNISPLESYEKIKLFIKEYID